MITELTTGTMPPNNYQSILSQLTYRPPKRKVFISYHHQDQAWIDGFRTTFGGLYDVFTDCSLDQAIDSINLPYINRTIREDYITGSSITIVLCGNDTWRRKCVDWEIHSTLHKDHALLGIVLPHVTGEWINGQQIRRVPDRLFTNINTNYAHWIEYPQDTQALSQAIDHALQRSSSYRNFKDNSAQKMSRNI
jgi:hypothetical protein